MQQEEVTYDATMVNMVERKAEMNCDSSFTRGGCGGGN